MPKPSNKNLNEKEITPSSPFPVPEKVSSKQNNFSFSEQEVSQKNQIIAQWHLETIRTVKSQKNLPNPFEVPRELLFDDDPLTENSSTYSSGGSEVEFDFHEQIEPILKISTGKEFKYYKIYNRLVLGKDPEYCNILIDDPSINIIHCVFTTQNDRVFVKTAGSFLIGGKTVKKNDIQRIPYDRYLKVGKLRAQVLQEMEIGVELSPSFTPQVDEPEEQISISIDSKLFEEPEQIKTNIIIQIFNFFIGAIPFLKNYFKSAHSATSPEYYSNDHIKQNKETELSQIDIYSKIIKNYIAPSMLRSEELARKNVKGKSLFIRPIMYVFHLLKKLCGTYKKEDRKENDRIQRVAKTQKLKIIKINFGQIKKLSGLKTKTAKGLLENSILTLKDLSKTNSQKLAGILKVDNHEAESITNQALRLSPNEQTKELKEIFTIIDNVCEEHEDFINPKKGKFRILIFFGVSVCLLTAIVLSYYRF